MFEGVAVATLETWLSEAQAAYHDLVTGAQVRTLIHGAKRIEYMRADAPRLAAYVALLRAAVAGRTRSSAIGVIF